MQESEGLVLKPELQAPELTFFDEYYVKTFYRLTGSRQVGMGVAPIPISEILEYNESYLHDEDVEMLLDVIQAADSAYLTEYYKEQETKAK